MHYTTPLLNVCQGQNNEWNRRSTGTNEGQYGGHEGTNDNDDGSNYEHEEDEWSRHSYAMHDKCMQFPEQNMLNEYVWQCNDLCKWNAWICKW